MNNLLFVAFNRPDLTQKSLSQLLKLPWDNIDVYIDGPRNEHDVPAVLATATAVRELTLDIPNVHITERTENWGCRRNVSAAITSFFSKYQRGWVFEDDILIHDLEGFLALRKSWNLPGHLALYDIKVEAPKHNSSSDGHFPIWGWYLSHGTVPQFTNHSLGRVLIAAISQRGLLGGLRFGLVYLKTILGLLDTWDSLYTAWCLTNKIPCYTTSQQTVTNIGFDERATHTKKAPKNHRILE